MYSANVKIVKMPIADWLRYPPPLYINIGFGLRDRVVSAGRPYIFRTFSLIDDSYMIQSDRIFYAREPYIQADRIF